MSKRSKCAEQKERLMEELGSRCAFCSRTDGLEFDCVNPKGADHHGKSKCDRIRFYVREFALGNLQLLCETCHMLKSIRDRQKLRTLKRCEFTQDSESGLRPVLREEPEPSVSDWPAWCKWHAGKQ